MGATFNGFRVDDLDAAMSRAREPLAQLNGARIFITGGTGFIGQWLLALLAHARRLMPIEFDAVVLTRDQAAFLARRPDFAELDWLRFHSGEIESFSFPDGAFTHVIHAATDSGIAADDDPAALSMSIIEGTRRVLAFCAASGARRALYLSSGAVYGRQPASLDRMPETHAGGPDPLDPRAVYAESKRAAEMLCAIHARQFGCEIVSARIFATLGPGLPLDGHFAAGNFTRDAMRGRNIEISGDGSPLRSYLYVGDLAAWLIALLVRGQSASAYNVGSDKPVSILDLARAAKAALRSGGEVILRGLPDRNAERSRYVPSIDRARALGLDVWTPLDVAIQRTAEHASLIEAPPRATRKLTA